MRKIIGGKAKKKEVKDAPSLDEVSSNSDQRIGSVDDKVTRLNKDLAKLTAQMKKVKKGTAPYNSLAQRAMKILKQKKMYEKQKDSIQSQQFNIDQAKFAIGNLQESANVVAAMKGASGQIKKAYKEVNIDEIEDMHDEMSELLEDADEINDALGRTYGVPDELDEDELMGELDTLEDELGVEEEVPDYLINAASASKKPLENKEEVDEFGMPKQQVKV